MNEQTRIRLELVTKRYERRLRQASDSDAGWLAAFDLVCRGVLRTAMTEIGAELIHAGHSCHIGVGEVDGMPSLDWTLEPRAAPDGRRMVRFFARHDEHKGWEVLAEVWLSGTPCELTRFRSPNDLTAEVAEKLLVDAVEQIFAAAGSSAISRSQSTNAEAVPPRDCRDQGAGVPGGDSRYFVEQKSTEVVANKHEVL